MITASVDVDSNLLLEPSNELWFPHPLSGQRSQCILTLTNLSPVHGVLFRMRTRDPNAFAVRPTHGLVQPGTSFQVTIIATRQVCEHLLANDPHDLSIYESSELFLVQSLEVGDKLRHLTYHDLQATTLLRTIWKQVPKESIAEKKMFCRFMESTPEVTQDEKMLSQSTDSTDTFSKTFLCTHGVQSSLRSMALPNFGGSTFPNLSLSSHYTSFEEMRGEDSHSRDSLDSQASIHTTADCSTSMDSKVLASMNNAFLVDSYIEDGRAEAEMSSRLTSSTRQRYTVPTSFDDGVMAVNDTMISALSTDPPPCEYTQVLSPPLYRIQPSDVLSFDVKPAPHFWGSTSFSIVNESQNDCLIFKVRTSNQSGYIVKPSRGVLSTTSAQKVVVSLCAPHIDTIFDPAERQAKDGFIVEVANISRDKCVELKEMTEQRRKSEITSLWSFVSQDERRSSKLSVQFKAEYGYGISGTNSSEDVSTSSSTGESYDGEGKSTGKCTISELDMSALMTTRTPDLKCKDGMDNVAETLARKGSGMFVTSFNRIDTFDVPNPNFSLYV